MRVGLGLVTDRERSRRNVAARGHGLLEGADPPGTEVLVRALVDALLGAAGLAGRAEPASRARGTAEGAPAETARGRWEGGPEELLREGVRRIERENYQVVNVDAILSGDFGSDPETEGGACGGRLQDLGSRIAGLLHVAPSHVSLAARDLRDRAEGRGTRSGREPLAPGDPRAAPFRATVIVLLDRIGDTDALLASIRSGG